MTDQYYVVMCTRYTDPGHEVEYSGIRWGMDQEPDAKDELVDAQLDSTIKSARIKEVSPW